MKDIKKHRFFTHNLSFDEKSFDESNFAEEISKKYHLNTKYYQMPGPKKVSEDFSNIIFAMDQPMSDTAFISNFYLSKFSGKVSKVVLSGDGGDELFGGYETYLADYGKKITNIFPNIIVNFLNKFIVSNFKSSYEFKVGTNYKIKKFFENLNMKDGHAHILWRSIFNFSEINNLINTESNDFKTFFLNEVTNEYSKVNGCNFLDQNIFLDLKTWFSNDILYKIDRTSMFSSQESRLPFIDPEIVKFSFQLPSNLKIKLFNKKILLKKSLNKKMNEKYVNRKKSGFNTPVGTWIAEDKNFRELTQVLLNSKNIQTLIKKNFIDDLLKNHINKHEDNTYKIFNLMVLSQWLESNKITI